MVKVLGSDMIAHDLRFFVLQVELVFWLPVDSPDVDIVQDKVFAGMSTSKATIVDIVLPSDNSS